jgi:hypothetical protein
MPRTAISGLVCTTFLVLLGFPAVPQEPAGKGAGHRVGATDIQQRMPDLPHDQGRRQSLGSEPPQYHRKESRFASELRLFQRHEGRGLCMGQGEARSLHRDTR